METFLHQWHEAAITSLGFFWMALWAFALGYLISSLIQVLVTRSRMQRTMGETGPKSIVLGTFFGFISSSCSFAALSTTRALFKKGAGLVPALAFMLSSTNLVIELGIVIAIFLSWQFVVGEYVGGILLILFAWLFVRLTNPETMISQARKRLGKDDEVISGESSNWRKKLFSREGWQNIGQTYVMEWQMVWKDVMIGFTIAGVISAFVPDSFFQSLFIGTGGKEGTTFSFIEVLSHTLVGPIAAFFTFIGSMGNIPLAALLFERGVSFAGVMAFIFSDLVVLPVLRINAAYYGWKMALYILILLLAGLVVVSLLMHYGFAAFDLLPQFGGGQPSADRDYFTFNYGFVLNIVFLCITAALFWMWHSGRQTSHKHNGSVTLTDKVLRGLALLSVCWLVLGSVLIPLLNLN